MKIKPEEREKEMPNKATQYLTPQQLVDRWNGAISTGALANWRNKGKGPDYIKFGSRVRYCLDDIVNYEQENRIKANDNERV